MNKKYILKTHKYNNDKLKWKKNNKKELNAKTQEYD